MQLYYSRNSNPRLAVAVARHVNAPVEFIPASPLDPAQTDTFRPLNPNLRVPILVEGSTSLWETDAIACRLCQITGSEFWPSPERLPELLRWLSWTASHLGPEASAFYFERIVRPTFSDKAASPARMDRHMSEFRHYAGILNDLLKGREWLIDDRLSYADFRVAFVFPFADQAGLPLADYPEVQRLTDQLNQIDAWRDPFAGLPG